MPANKEAGQFEKGKVLEFGDFRLDPELNVLWRQGQVVALGPKVVRTLAVLYGNLGEVVRREDLIRQVWGETAVEENSLAHNISVLRKILKENPSGFVIETVPRRGYRLCSVPVEVPKVIAAAEIPLAAKRGRRWIWSGLALAGVSLGVVVVLLAVTRKPQRSARRSIAVVGFASLSKQPDSSWLSPALSEMMVTELGAGGRLLTIPGENVARARQELKLEQQDGYSAETLAHLRRNLNADLVVSGAYMLLPAKPGEPGVSAENQVRLDLRVQDAASGETLDTISEIGGESTLFGLVARSGAHLRQRLGVDLPAAAEMQEAQSAVSANSQAVRLYAEGVEKLRSFDALGARTLLQQAVDADPKYALAHSALSSALATLGYESGAREHAKRAFELASGLSREEQIFVEARYRMESGQWEKAVALYNQLFGSYPDDLEYGLLLATAQAKASHGKDALKTLAALRQLRAPAGNDPRIRLGEYEAWKSLGDFAHMEQALSEAAENARQQGSLLLFARARSRQCWIQRARAEQDEAMKNCEEAQQIYRIAGDRRGQAEALRFMADIVSTNDVKAAIDDYKQALKLNEEIGHLGGQATVMSQMATLYSSQGDHATAEKLYEQAFDIFQRTDDRLNATGLMVDIGGEFAALGETQQAEKMYSDANEAAMAIGNRYIQSMAQFNLGLLEQVEGDLDAAQRSYNQALAGFKDTGSKEYDMAITRSMGEVAQAQGDLARARGLYQQAISMHQAPEQKLSAAETEMDLDQLSLEEGRHDVELEQSLRRVSQLFSTGNESSGNNAINDHSLSLALLARCLLAEGKSAEAMRTAEEAVQVSAHAEPSVRLSATVVAARVQFAVRGKEGATEAFASLRRAIDVARRFRCFGAELEAQLALGEIEVKTGAVDHGRTRLLAVEKNASGRGYLLLARRAKAAA